MRPGFIFAACLAAVLFSATIEKTSADLINLNDVSGTVRFSALPESNINSGHSSTAYANARVVAVGDVLTTSSGNEIVIAVGSPSTLNVYAADGSTLLATRGFGTETINQISIGECREDLAGLEIAVASQDSAGPVGLVRVLNLNAGSLADRNGTGAGFNVTEVKIADVDNRSGWEGGELIFTWVYDNAGSGNTQIAIYEPGPAGFSASQIRNFPGTVLPGRLAVGEALGNGGLPEICVGTNIGQLSLFTAAVHVEGGGNGGLVNYAVLNAGTPVSLRSGFTTIKAVAVDDISTTATSGEVVVFSLDGGGSLRSIKANGDGLPDALGVSGLATDASGLQILNDTIFLASPASGGSILQITPQLVQSGSVTGLGTWVDFKQTAGWSGFVPVELGSFGTE